MTEDDVKRVYRSALRDEQALATRARVVEAARELIVQQGYAGTSMAQVARAAGVSRETVYKAFGTKPKLLKATYDAAVVGDVEDVPMAEREVFRAIIEDPDPRSAFATFGRLSADLVGRLGPLMTAVQAGARGGEPDLRELAATSDAERLIGVRAIVTAVVSRGWLREGVTLDRAVDVVWMLSAPETCQLLVDGRGWTLDEYGAWLGTAAADAVLAPDQRRRGRRSMSASESVGAVPGQRFDAGDQ